MILFLLTFEMLVQGCASQSRFSSSFPQRLTQTQSVWYQRNHGNPNLPTSVSDKPENLQQILDRLVYVSPLRGYPVQVFVVQDSHVNAHTDGIHIYIHSGLLAVFHDQTDLVASVLAHELGHILANHQAQGSKRNPALGYLTYLTPALGVLPYGGLYGSAAGAALREGIHMRQYSYDQLQENEADAIGVFLATDAGYNAVGLSQFLDYVGGSGLSAPRSLSIPTSFAAIPQSAVVTLLSTSPLYQTHPRSKKRKKIVELILQRKKGIISQETLQKKSSWAADLYAALERSKPQANEMNG